MPGVKSGIQYLPGVLIFSAFALGLFVAPRVWVSTCGAVAIGFGLQSIIRRRITLSGRTSKKTTHYGVSAVLHGVIFVGAGVAAVLLGYFWNELGSGWKLD